MIVEKARKNFQIVEIWWLENRQNDEKMICQHLSISFYRINRQMMIDIDRQNVDRQIVELHCT